VIKRPLVVAAMALVPWSSGCGGDERLSPVPTRTELYEAVSPFIGTGGLGFGQGSTYPGPALPFGMIHPGPDTTAPGGAPAFAHCSGYWWDDGLIEGFSLTRMHGTGVPDYGTIGIMPVNGMTDGRRDEEGYRAGFDHAEEEAVPGYYRVRLDSGIDVEISTSRRAAIFRFTFPDDADPVVLVDLEHTLGEGQISGAETVVDHAGGQLSAQVHLDGDLSGRFGGFDLFAQAAFDPLPTRSGVWDDQGLRPDEPTAAGTDVGAWLGFPPGTRTVQLRVAISFVDGAGAAANLDSEIPSCDFDRVRQAADHAWRVALGKVEVWGADDQEATELATALYHTQLMPTLMSDVDGRALDATGQIVTSARPRFSDFSLWDTYRTLHPWLILTEHDHNELFAASLIAMASEGGAVPRWSLAHGDAHCMIGSPGEIVLAGSAAKGVTLDDEQRAYDLSRVAAFGPSPGPCGGRGAIEDYLALGYVPADGHGGSVSKTQEYAAADGALAAWAQRLGRDADAVELEARAASWQRLYDPELGFFRGKNSDGSWADWYGAHGQADIYTEGTAWQYLWMVPHDIEGLAAILGGQTKARARLGELFRLSAAEEGVLGFRKYYWHGNEPDLIAPWLFAAWGAPNESIRWIDWAVDEFYGTGPDGLAGNDDGGTLSAWLLFAAAGIYPVAGFDRYIVAAPRFPRVVLHRPSGDLRIEAFPDPRIHHRVVEGRLDGRLLEGPFLTHDQLVGEHELSFRMD